MEHIGEVVESSTKGFIARSPRMGESPSFGSFVRTDSEPRVYGLVYEILTGSKEPGRKPTAYDMSIEELRREQPQIFELLKTEFHVLTLAYLEGGKIRFALSPLPPPIHTFVHMCSDEEKKELSSEDFFLRAIVSSSNVPVDDLIISSLYSAQNVRKKDKDYMVRMGKSLSRFFRDDYERLSSILRRVL
ncbi:MAG: HAS-barrel domain-containing protein [Deltaproteobacteria bacterium]